MILTLDQIMMLSGLIVLLSLIVAYVSYDLGMEVGEKRGRMTGYSAGLLTGRRIEREAARQRRQGLLPNVPRFDHTAAWRRRGARQEVLTRANLASWRGQPSQRRILS